MEATLLPQPAQRKLSLCQWAWYLLVYTHSPVHTDAITAIIDFRALFGRCPPGVPPETAGHVRFFAYLLFVAAVWNLVVWIAGVAAVMPLWNCAEAWTSSTHHVGRWLASWEQVLLFRAISRKLTTVICKPAPGVTPLAPVGMAFDLVLWNGFQIILACKIFSMLSTVPQELQALLGSKQMGFVTQVLMLTAWTAVADSALRLAWPFAAICMDAEFNRSAVDRELENVLSGLPESAENHECLICLSSSGGLCQLPCGHFFHRQCLADWFRVSPTEKICPTCRRSFYESQPVVQAL